MDLYHGRTPRPFPCSVGERLLSRSYIARAPGTTEILAARFMPFANPPAGPFPKWLKLRGLSQTARALFRCAKSSSWELSCCYRRHFVSHRIARTEGGSYHLND